MTQGKRRQAAQLIIVTTVGRDLHDVGTALVPQGYQRLQLLLGHAMLEIMVGANSQLVGGARRMEDITANLARLQLAIHAIGKRQQGAIKLKSLRFAPRPAAALALVTNGHQGRSEASFQNIGRNEINSKISELIHAKLDGVGAVFQRIAEFLQRNRVAYGHDDRRRFSERSTSQPQVHCLIPPCCPQPKAEGSQAGHQFPTPIG